MGIPEVDGLQAGCLSCYPANGIAAPTVNYVQSPTP